MDTEAKKKVLERLIRGVLELKESGIEKVRRMRMLNLKLIERSSKCTKDPNPLATTMWIMNTKYPIAINKKLAIKHNIPKEYLCPGKVGEDSHKYGLVLAKKDTVNWWITQSGSPSDETMKVARILLNDSRKQVEQYYSYNWKESKIKWGQPIMERRIVSTRTPMLQVPSHLREDLIKEIMFPDTTLPSSRLSQPTIEKMKELINLNMETKITLLRQIRILINNLDPQQRYLPVIPGFSDKSIGIKHALCHSNFVLTNCQSSRVEEIEENWSEEIENIGKCLIFEGKTTNLSPAMALELIPTMFINKEPVRKYIELVPNRNTLGTMVLKSLLGERITLERTFEELQICPFPTNCIWRDLINQRGFEINWMDSMENNNFKFGEMRGTFTRAGTVLISMSTNYTTLRDLKALLSKIATYILWDFQATKGNNLMQCKKEIREKVFRAPHKFIQCTFKNWLSVGSGRQGNYGILTVMDGQEYINTGSFQFNVTPTWDLELSATQQKITTHVNCKELRSFSEAVFCNNSRLLNHFNLKRTIKHMFNIFMRNFDKLIQEIKGSNFKWNNSYMNKFMPSNYASISQACRFVCSNLINQGTHNPSSICLAYCFANRDPQNSPIGPTKFILKDGTIVDLEGQEGIFRYNPETSIYMLYGVETGKTVERLHKSSFMTGLLEGYRLIPDESLGKKLITVRKLEQIKNTIPEGSENHIYIAGRCYLAVKDSTVRFSMTSTINRHLQEILDRHLTQGEQIILGKRSWLQAGEDSDEEPELAPKRRRLDSESEMIDTCDLNTSSMDPESLIEDDIDLEVMEEEN